jgi:hypothetical protein
LYGQSSFDGFIVGVVIVSALFVDRQRGGKFLHLNGIRIMGQPLPKSSEIVPFNLSS